MIPRFNAADFSSVTFEMKEAYSRDGVLVLDQMIRPEDCDALKNRMTEMVNDFDYDSHRTSFSTIDQKHAQDQYFLESGGDIRFFFEEDAFDDEGKLRVEPEKAINKVGHAMHDIDPEFNRVSRLPQLKELVYGLGMADPLLLQSMYIFKQPHIGGEVRCHQDATFLWTEPQTVMGLWVALEDATISNGCLWGIPGAHKTDQPKQRLRRTADDKGTEMITLDETPFQETGRLPLEAPKGTVLAFSGLFPHLSGANRSPKSRHAYTLHIVDKNAEYPEDNWLRRNDDLPARGFD